MGRRRLFTLVEDLVGDLRLLLQNVTLQAYRVDRWIWRLKSPSIYTVCSAYNYLNAQVPIDHVVHVSSLWHKDLPLKMVLFAWRLFRDRLPTMDNLSRRHVIDIDAQSCVGGCGFQETSAHLFLDCNLFGSVWNHNFRWLGVSAVLPHDVAGFLNQFSFFGGTAKSRQSILQVIWYATV